MKDDTDIKRERKITVNEERDAHGNKIKAERTESTYEREHPKEIHHHHVFGTVVSVLIILLLTLAVLFIPYKTITVSEVVPYTELESYNTPEPYNTSETFNQAVPYQVQGYKVPEYSITSDYVVNSSGQGIFGCNITNEEDVSIEFEYYVYTSDSNKTNWEQSMSKTVTIPGGDTFRAEETLTPRRYSGCRVMPEIIAKDELSTQLRNISVERNVTKYRDVIQNREVVKLRNVTYTTQVNWILGVKMPWHKEWPA